jgi:hypothetical protein
MRKIIITESQLKTIIENELNEDKHQSKEVKKLIDWSEKYLKCYTKPSKDGIKLCPPDEMGFQCRPTHLADKALYDIERDLAKWFGVTKQEIHSAYKGWRDIKREEGKKDVDERSRSFAFTRKKRNFTKSEMMANPDRYKDYDKEIKGVKK